MPRTVRPAAALALALALACALLPGCGDGKPAAVPAGGKVTFRKKTPAAGALVVFHPTDPAVEKVIGGKPVGTVREDGTFALSTHADADGAPPGEYGVTIDWRKKGGDSKFALGGGEGAGGGQPMLQPRFSNPQQPFTTVTVKKGEKNEFEFDVE